MSTTLDAYLRACPDRCPTCGWHPVQGHAPTCAPVGPASLRDAALEAVSEAADPATKAALELAIRRHASSGAVFSMNDLRREVDVSGPVVGSVFGHLSKLGVIERVGSEPSTKANTKSHEIKTWKGRAA